MIVKTNPDEFENFVIDASNFKGNCEAVYFPESVDDVKSIVKDANTNRYIEVCIEQDNVINCAN